MSDQDFISSLTNTINITRNTETTKEYDNFGNEITNTIDGNYPTIASDVKALILSLTGTVININLKQLNLTDEEAYLMYVEFDIDIQKEDYIIDQDGDKYLVTHVNENIAEKHHKEVFLKKVEN